MDVYDRERFFLWVEEDEEKEIIKFTLDRPYHVPLLDNSTGWALLIPPSGWPTYEMACQFCRSTILCSTKDHHDGNHSWAKVLSKSEEYGTLYKIVLCGMGGGGAHQEPMNTFIIHRSLDGKWSFVAEKVGLDATGKCGGSECINYSTAIQVEWTGKSQHITFEVKFIRKRVTCFVGESETDSHDSTTFREGSLTGDSFPLEINWEKNEYTVAKEGEELENILIAYAAHLPWSDKEYLIEVLEKEIRRSNSDVNFERPFKEETKLILPDRSRLRKIMNENK